MVNLNNNNNEFLLLLFNKIHLDLYKEKYYKYIYPLNAHKRDQHINFMDNYFKDLEEGIQRIKI